MRFPDDVPRLTDGVVTLRAHRSDDAPAVVEQSLDPVSIRWTVVPLGYTLDDARRFLNHAMPAGWEQETEWAFAISASDDSGNERYGGTCSLRDKGDGRAEIAYGAHPWIRGRGYVHRALRLLVEWGFSERGYATMVWLAHVGNWPSRKAAWKLGFSCIGTLDGWLPQRGTLRDSWVGVLRASDPRMPRHAWYDAPRIVGAGVVLRAHSPKDAARIVEACNDSRSRQWLANLPSPYTVEDADAFMESRKEQMASGTTVHWAIADPRTDLLVGVVNIFDVKPAVDGEVGYWTHPAVRGRGVMTEACGLAVRHGFVPAEDGGLGLRRMTAYAAVGNGASRHVIESCGFRQYGVERRGVEVGGGALADLACYDLLVEEYGPSATWAM